MDSRRFSRSTKRAAFKRANGCCERCSVRLPVGGGGIHFDHVIPWWISHDSSLDNCQTLCVECHKKKTGTKDAQDIARTRNLADSFIGIKPEVRKPLPGGRNSAITISFRGPVKRKTQAEKHREFIRNRQIGGGE